MIDQKTLHEKLSYCPETGVFRWKIPVRGVEPGSEAGSINDQGYRLICIDKIRHRASRLAWLYVYGEHPKGVIDHLDRNRLNNVISNLRDVPRSLNQKNSKRNRNNTSGYNGVRWYKPLNKWHVQLQVDYNKIHIGYFENLDDAIAARKAADLKYNFTHNHGEGD